MVCPRCGLPDEVPPTSRRCACGFDLVAGGGDAPGMRSGVGVAVLLALPITLVIASALHDATPAIVHAAIGLVLALAGARRDRSSFPTARLHR